MRKGICVGRAAACRGLLELRRELLADAVLTDRTRRKVRDQEQHGLRLCALPTAETPLGIFDAPRRLRGTLAFIAEAVLGDDSSANV